METTEAKYTTAGPAKAAIEIESVTFTGGPAWRQNGTSAEVFVPHPGPIDYAGIPSPEVDAAWEELTQRRSLCALLSPVTKSLTRSLLHDDGGRSSRDVAK